MTFETMHLQSPKELNEGMSLRPGPSSTVHGYIFSSPDPHPPSFLPLFLFLNIHLLDHLWQRSLPRRQLCRSVFIRTPTLNLSMYKENKHTSSLYIRGERGKKKQQARCIHHKDYTLIPVHTALCTDTMATSPAAPIDSCKRSSLNSLWDYRWRLALQLSLPLCISQLIT